MEEKQAHARQNLNKYIFGKLLSKRTLLFLSTGFMYCIDAF